MRSSRLKKEHGETTANSPADSVLSIRQLAHELNSLLDGSMRSVRQAESALDTTEVTETQALDKVLLRLRTAERSMKDMSEVLRRAMEGGETNAKLLQSYRTLAEEARCVVESVEPLAEQHRVDMVVEISERAADLPAATLGPVILNGLRNAVQACAAPGLPSRRVDVCVDVDLRTDELTLLISDSGPGLPKADDVERFIKPNGHGLGLGVCAEIVAELDGKIELTNIPFRGGAVLQVRIPLRSLEDE